MILIKEIKKSIMVVASDLEKINLIQYFKANIIINLSVIFIIFLIGKPNVYSEENSADFLRSLSDGNLNKLYFKVKFPDECVLKKDNDSSIFFYFFDKNRLKNGKFEIKFSPANENSIPYGYRKNEDGYFEILNLIRLQDSIRAAINKKQGVYLDFFAALDCDQQKQELIPYKVTFLKQIKEAWQERSFEFQLNMNYYKGRIYLKNNDFNQAIKKFEEALSLEPNNNNIINDLLASFVKQKSWQNGLKVFNKLLSDNPKNINILKSLVFFNLKVSNLSEVIKNSRKVIAIIPEDESTRIILSHTYLKQGKKNLAIKEFNEIIKISKDQDMVATSMKKLAILYFETMKFAEMKNTILNFHKKFGENAESHFLLGKAYLGIGNIVNAELEFENAGRLDQRYAQGQKKQYGKILYLFGQIHRKYNRLTIANRFFDRSCQIGYLKACQIQK